MSDQPLILASTSVYRRQLLQRLVVGFDSHPPVCDEQPLVGETAKLLALRLAVVKARSLANRFGDAVIIGSDQTARCGRRLLGKPLDMNQATEQLTFCSGRQVTFHTGLAVLNARSGRIQQAVVDTRVVFRTISEAQIQRYLAREHTLDCAGSFKAEGLGISLFRHLGSDDPTALLGLPLICLTSFLLTEGFTIP